MKFTEEMVKSARECKSVDEIMGLAKDNGIDITEGEARSYFAKFNHTNCELSDEELDVVCGGCGGGDDKECDHDWKVIETCDDVIKYKCSKCGEEKTEKLESKIIRMV